MSFIHSVFWHTYFMPNTELANKGGKIYMSSKKSVEEAGAWSDYSNVDKP